MKKHLEVIKVFTNKEEWLKNIKNNNFINYFNSLDKDEKNEIEIYYVIFKDDNRKDFSKTDQVILNYIDNQINLLLEISKKRKLKIKESKFVSLFLGRLILNNKEVSSDSINTYINNCYLNNKNIGISSDLIILLKYSFNYFNDYNNSNIKFLFKDSEYMGDAFAKFNGNTDNLDNKIFVRSDYYENFINGYERIDLDIFYYFLIYQIMSVLHEYRHYLQFKVLNRECFNEMEERIIKEYTIINENIDFYNEYHHSFFLEIDANRYAIDNIDYFIRELISNSCYKEIKYEIIEIFKSLIYDKIDISNLIDCEYNKLVKK